MNVPLQEAFMESPSSSEVLYSLYLFCFLDYGCVFIIHTHFLYEVGEEAGKKERRKF
jgi:hypothetical protein